MIGQGIIYLEEPLLLTVLRNVAEGVAKTGKEAAS